VSDPVIIVQEIGKKYRLGATIRHDTIRDVLANGLKSMFQRGQRSLSSEDTPQQGKKQRRRDRSDFWALQDVSFKVDQGEVVGIIGRNGSGKSTLLKIISEITEPTTGEARIRGRVGSLLEVGTGFHPELTGRENIFLNGAILGMSRTEIKQKFDQIVEFSEIGKFIDTPVKRYSSGMYVRLAFAVAAHLEPEILLIDEVLAVGDVRFQQKCIGKMGEVSNSGRTILFVSHNMDTILNLCSAVYVLDNGHISEKLDPQEGVRRYLNKDTNSLPLSEHPRFQISPGLPIIHDLSISDSRGRKNIVTSAGSVRFDITLRNLEALNGIACAIAITNQHHQRVVYFDTRHHANSFLKPCDTVLISCYVPSLPLIPGPYYIDIIVSDRNSVIERVEQAAQLEVVFADVFGTGRLPSHWQGHLVLLCEWKAEPKLISIL